MNKIVLKNYEEFKELFVREDGKRKNRIILDMWEDRDFRRFVDTNPAYRGIYRVKTMADLFALCDHLIACTTNGEYRHGILGNYYYSSLYRQDSGGICFDGDYRAYRYWNKERDAIFKMRIGKMYRHFIDTSEFGKNLPESVKLYLCEEISAKWQAHCRGLHSAYELHVDDDFAKIYDSEECIGDFNSCMTDDENYHFYENAVEAKAAYLTNKEGYIVARCVIFTKAIDKDGKVWRLAERQYSSDGDELFKRMLIHALIQGGHIDGYKKVGAGCHDPRLWMDTQDNRIPDAYFSIKCYLEDGDYISYQDSFKWFDYEAQRAYNHNADGLDDNLSTTDLYFERKNYDSWHEEYTKNEVCTVYSGGREYTCDEDRLEDFRYVRNRDEWHHEDDVVWCECCDEYVLSDDAYFLEETEQYYCCESCYNDAKAELEEDEE